MREPSYCLRTASREEVLPIFLAYRGYRSLSRSLDTHSQEHSSCVREHRWSTVLVLQQRPAWQSGIAIRRHNDDSAVPAARQSGWSRTGGDASLFRTRPGVVATRRIPTQGNLHPRWRRRDRVLPTGLVKRVVGELGAQPAQAQPATPAWSPGRRRGSDASPDAGVATWGPCYQVARRNPGTAAKPEQANDKPLVLRPPASRTGNARLSLSLIPTFDNELVHPLPFQCPAGR